MENHDIHYENCIVRLVDELQEHNIYYKKIYCDPKDLNRRHPSDFHTPLNEVSRLGAYFLTAPPPHATDRYEDKQLYLKLKALDDELERIGDAKRIYDPYRLARQCHNRGVASECSGRPVKVPDDWVFLGTAKIVRISPYMQTPTVRELLPPTIPIQTRNGALKERLLQLRPRTVQKKTAVKKTKTRRNK